MLTCIYYSVLNLFVLLHLYILSHSESKPGLSIFHQSGRGGVGAVFDFLWLLLELGFESCQLATLARAYSGAAVLSNSGRLACVLNVLETNTCTVIYPVLSSLVYSVSTPLFFPITLFFPIRIAICSIH